MAIGANVRQGNFSVVACFDDESVRLCFAFDFGNRSYSLQSFLDLNTRLKKQILAEGLKRTSKVRPLKLNGFGCNKISLLINRMKEEMVK